MLLECVATTPSHSGRCLHTNSLLEYTELTTDICFWSTLRVYWSGQIVYWSVLMVYWSGLMKCASDLMCFRLSIFNIKELLISFPLPLLPPLLPPHPKFSSIYLPWQEGRCEQANQNHVQGRSVWLCRAPGVSLRGGAHRLLPWSLSGPIQPQTGHYSCQAHLALGEVWDGTRRSHAMGYGTHVWAK